MWHADRFTGRLFTGGGEDWRQRAACRDHDPELFFPTGLAERTELSALPGKSRAQAKVALRVCQGCPVRGECLEWALEFGDAWAIVGGTLPRARRLMRLRHKRMAEMEADVLAWQPAVHTTQTGASCA